MNLSWEAIVKATRKILGSLSFGQRTALFLVCSGVLAGLILMLVWAGKPRYRVLFSGLDSERASQIVQELGSRGVDYEIDDGGGTIRVPYDQVEDLRLQLVSEGIVAGGEPKGYELLDQFKFGLPEGLQLFNRKRALEGELARTISRVASIKRAVVHITPSNQTPYRDREQPAKASVMLELQGPMKLDPSQIAGIAHLIAGSVEGLTADEVTILDSKGNVLSLKTVEMGMNAASRQLQIQKEMESYRAGKCQGMLDDVFGAGMVSVRVSAELDFRKAESTIETYDPDSSVVRSEKVNKSETTSPTPPGSTGAAARLGGVSPQGSEAKADSNERTTEYDNSRTVQTTVEDGVKIKRLAIGLVIDESLTDKRSDLEAIVKNSVGFDVARGDTLDTMVTKFPVAPEPPPPPGFLETIDIVEVTRYASVVVSFLLAFLLIRFLVGKGRKGLATAETVIGLPARGERLAIDEGEARAVREQVIRAIEQDPVEASRLLQAWLAEED